MGKKTIKSGLRGKYCRSVSSLPSARLLSLRFHWFTVYRVSVYKSQIKKTMDQGEEAFQVWLESHERRQQRKKAGLVVQKPVERAAKPSETPEAREVSSRAHRPVSRPFRVLTLTAFTTFRAAGPTRLGRHGRPKSQQPPCQEITQRTL